MPYRGTKIFLLAKILTFPCRIPETMVYHRYMIYGRKGTFVLFKKMVRRVKKIVLSEP